MHGAGARLAVGGAADDGGVIALRQRARLKHIVAVPAIVPQPLLACGAGPPDRSLRCGTLLAPSL